jgi:polyferredoxin
MLKPQTAKQHRIVRFCIQLVFFILAPGLFSAAFNGIKYIFAQVGAISALELTSFVSLLIALCLFTVIFGRFFCGFACSFGMLGDVVYALFTPLRKRLGMPARPITGKVEQAARFIKHAFLIAICVLSFLQLSSAISPYDPWVAFASLTSLQVAGISVAAVVILALIVCGMALQERFFCEFLCPLGAVFSLLPHLPATSFLRISHNCPSSCGRCKKNCPVGIYPDANSFSSGECIGCGRCADMCPLDNIGMARLETLALEGKKQQLEAGLAGAASAVASPKVACVATAEGAPSVAMAAASSSAGAATSPSATSSAKEGKARKAKKALPVKVRGSELASVLIKAALLLVVCYLLGQLRFLS